MQNIFESSVSVISIIVRAEINTYYDETILISILSR